ncbi:hypothetical protein AU476_12530 [Cupriavidus sp. UYMSc13B]|nr:hypothetical protein AU476_12530 [Cupriavidus sp. UYMSc13B]
MLHVTRIVNDGASGKAQSSSAIERMVTRRAARSTVWPARAYSYSGRPSFFSAECIGGTCSISPRKLASACSTAARSQVTSRTSSSSPSASPVLERAPRRTSAS